MLDADEHKRFIDRQAKMTESAKKTMTADVLGMISGRRLMSDSEHAKDRLVEFILRRSRGVFIRAGRVGDELAKAKRG